MHSYCIVMWCKGFPGSRCRLSIYSNITKKSGSLQNHNASLSRVNTVDDMAWNNSYLPSDLLTDADGHLAVAMSRSDGDTFVWFFQASWLMLNYVGLLLSAAHVYHGFDDAPR